MRLSPPVPTTGRPHRLDLNRNGSSLSLSPSLPLCERDINSRNYVEAISNRRRPLAPLNSRWEVLKGEVGTHSPPPQSALGRPLPSLAIYLSLKSQPSALSPQSSALSPQPCTLWSEGGEVRANSASSTVAARHRHPHGTSRTPRQNNQNC